MRRIERKKQVIKASDKRYLRYLNSQEKEIVQKLQPVVMKEILSLRRYERRVLSRLNKDEDLAKLFLVDPGAALAKMDVPVPPTIRKRLKPEAGLREILRPKKFRLPNGQVITPRVRIRFTGRRRVRRRARE